MAKKKASRDEMADKEKQLVTLMQDMQAEFKSMCKEREKLVETRKALEELFPTISELTDHVRTLAEHVETLMREHAEKEHELLKTLPQPLRPSVSGQPSPDVIGDVWAQGSGPQIIGMEISPRERPSSDPGQGPS